MKGGILLLIAAAVGVYMLSQKREVQAAAAKPETKVRYEVHLEEPGKALPPDYVPLPGPTPEPAPSATPTKTAKAKAAEAKEVAELNIPIMQDEAMQKAAREMIPGWDGMDYMQQVVAVHYYGGLSYGGTLEEAKAAYAAYGYTFGGGV